MTLPAISTRLSFPPLRLTGSSGLALGTCLALLLALPVSGLAQEDDDTGFGDSTGKTSTKKDKYNTPEEEFVHENLQEFLNPTTFVNHEDGRVTMTFDFRRKKEEHVKIFTPPLKGGTRSKFRYTVYQEEVVVGGSEGLRLSDKGIALLNCWFTDDLEIHSDFLQYINQNPRLSAGLIYYTDKGKGLGCNYGTQLAEYSRGKVKRKAGSIEPISFNTVAPLGLKITKGSYQALRKGRTKQEGKYKTKDFPSGRVGFHWGGSTALIVPNLKITGRIDYKATAKNMKKMMRMN